MTESRNDYKFHLRAGLVKIIYYDGKCNCSCTLTKYIPIDKIKDIYVDNSFDLGTVTVIRTINNDSYFCIDSIDDIFEQIIIIKEVGN